MKNSTVVKIWYFLPEMLIAGTMLFVFGSWLYASITQSVPLFRNAGDVTVFAYLGIMFVLSVVQFFRENIVVSIVLSFMLVLVAVFLVAGGREVMSCYPQSDPQGVRYFTKCCIVAAAAVAIGAIMPVKYIKKGGRFAAK